ncbi:MAG: twin-arginine translocase subunit TatC [Candidatus Stahlbacteria bacterium]|nr:twin-arginine translocase subunit TatC [Candidatus Stahlbacteria bacterium]
MGFIEHLSELRYRLIVSIVAVIIGMCWVYTQTTRILDYLSTHSAKLFFFSPTEAFVVRLKIALFGGIYLGLPVIFYQIWRFVESGLRETERKYIFLLIIFSVLLFTAGAVFAYFIMVPIAIKFFLSCGTSYVQPFLSVDRYVSFVGNFILSFGLVFQLPIVIFFLTKLGILHPKLLMRNQKYAVLIIFIVAAIVTPGPDVFSQTIVAGPLLVLYEISILISMLTIRRNRKVAVVENKC